MKYSIRFKLALLLVVLMIITIFATTVISHAFMQTYFEHLMQKSLLNSFQNLEIMLDEDSSGEEIKRVLSSVSASSDDANMLVLDKKSGIPYTTTNEEGRMKDSLVMLANLILNQERLESDIDEQSSNADMSEGSTPDGHYIIQLNHDNRLNADYYDLLGQIGNRYYIAIRRSVSFVAESVDAATHVFTIVGIITTIIGSVAMLLVATRFTRPIHNMAIVATKMQNLDFDATVEVRGKDEISALGNAMNDLSSRLEKTISELKAANIELSEDIEKKEQIDEMRRDFLAHVSHELKTPIALIQGYAEGLKENISDDAESRDFYCEVIMDEANKMNIMVKRLLSLNELEFGNTKLDVQRFDVVALVENIIQSSSILLQDFDGTLNVQKSEPIYVWADEYMISEVITNYLTNAIHYVLPKGEIRINYFLEEGQVKVQVYNTGNSLPEEELDKIWVKFYKVDKARTREYGGNGIGLSIVAATMEAHNKEYGVRNMEDGIAFYFCLDTDTSC